MDSNLNKLISHFIREKHACALLSLFELCLVLLVGPSGLEPPTSCLSGTRSNLLSYEPMWLVSDFFLTWLLMGFDSRRGLRALVADGSNSPPDCYSLPSLFESLPIWDCLSPLYWRDLNSPMVEMMGFEPMTPCLQGRCSPS